MYMCVCVCACLSVCLSVSLSVSVSVCAHARYECVCFRKEMSRDSGYRRLNDKGSGLPLNPLSNFSLIPALT